MNGIVDDDPLSNRRPAALHFQNGGLVMRSPSAKVASPLLALALLLSTALACGGGTNVPTQGALATNPPEPAATLEQAQPTGLPAATTAPGPTLNPPTATPPATLSERGTPDEAKAMLEKAVEHYNLVGREQALADFTGKVAPFFDRDLYVVCLDSRHIEIANGGFPQYVGTSADALLDADGNPLGNTIWDAASNSNEGSVNYRWVNPVSGQTEPKTLFFQKVGLDVCGVGAYNPP